VLSVPSHLQALCNCNKNRGTNVTPRENYPLFSHSDSADSTTLLYPPPTSGSNTCTRAFILSKSRSARVTHPVPCTHANLIMQFPLEKHRQRLPRRAAETIRPSRRTTKPTNPAFQRSGLDFVRPQRWYVHTTVFRRRQDPLFNIPYIQKKGIYPRSGANDHHTGTYIYMASWTAVCGGVEGSDVSLGSRSTAKHWHFLWWTLTANRFSRY